MFVRKILDVKDGWEKVYTRPTSDNYYMIDHSSI